MNTMQEISERVYEHIYKSIIAEIDDVNGEEEKIFIDEDFEGVHISLYAEYDCSYEETVEGYKIVDLGSIKVTSISKEVAWDIESEDDMYVNVKKLEK